MGWHTTVRKQHLNAPEQIFICIFSKNMDMTVQVWSEGKYSIDLHLFMVFCFLVIAFFDCYIAGAKIIQLLCLSYRFS